MNDAAKLLVVGGPSSGKTTYRTQIYQRVEHHDGELRLAESVKDMTALNADIERLVQGLQPMHTQSDIYQSTTLVLRDRANREISLEFADYGGEQVRKISESSSVPSAWVDRARESSLWLFFLRIDQVRPAKSFMTEPLETEPRVEAQDETSHDGRSTELRAVETLQRLLFVRGASLRHRLSAPRLGMLLSCWDELPETERKQKPSAILQHRASLLSRFITSNWEPDAIRIWGLSSTGQRLPEDLPDLEFARKGPEKAGYVVLEEGDTSPDLTLPLNWLLRSA